MRLPKTDDLLQKIPGWPHPQVIQTLPDYAHIAELGGLGALGRDLVQTQMTQRALTFVNAQVFQQATQIAFGNIISGVGLPKGPMASSVLDILGSFDPLSATETALRQLATSLIQAVEKMTMVALTDAINAGVGMAIDAAALVPVVGWIVKICWDVGKLIYNLVQMTQHDAYSVKELYPPSRFSPSADRDFLNLMLQRLAGADWSGLFYPPSAGKNESWKKAIYVVDLENGGLRFVGDNGGGLDNPWMGFVPGTAWVHRAIETAGKNRPPQTPMVFEVGKTMLPSVQQQCTWIWRHVAQTNSPAAFTVHADSAANLWQVYIDDLRVALREAKQLDGSLRTEIFRMYDRQLTKDGKSYPVFGWGDGSKEKDYSPATIMATLRKRQLDFCKTLTVAYVDTTFGALGDPAVKAAVDKYQRELLEHPAVCDVDLTNVPDELLADEIRSRRKHHNCIVYGGDKFAATTENPPGVVDGFAMPGDGATGTAAGPRSGPSGLQIAGAAAAVAGILSLLRR